MTLLRPRVPDTRRPRGPVRALVVALRPRQWMKNLLAVGAPLAAGDLGDVRVVRVTVLAVLALTLAASCGYLLNDLHDVAEDRGHPVKRLRPLAAGELSVALARVAAALLAAGAVATALAGSTALAATVVGYLLLTIAYTYRLRREPVVELVTISLFFVLRAAAGGFAAGIPLSPWFLLVAGFGSLFMVSGKRYAEFSRDTDRPGRRTSLAAYSLGYLRFVWATAAALTLITYLLWANQVYTVRDEGAWALWSFVPLVLGLLRYALHLEAGTAEAPEDVVLHDRFVQVMGLMWLVLFAFGVNGVDLGY